MRMFSQRTVMLLIAVFALSACASLNPFNREEKKSKIEGERVAVLVFEDKLEVDEELAAMPVDLPRPYRNEDWPQPGGYANHAMYHLEGPNVMVRLWSVSVGKGGGRGSLLTSSPIVAEGKIFTIDTTVRVSAFDAVSGKGLWRADLHTSPEKAEVGFGGGIAYEDGKIFVSTGFGDVYALSPADGSILWRKRFGEAFRSAPTVNGGRVYVTSFENQLYVLNASDGEILWNHRAIAEGARILSSSSPAVAGEALVAPFTSGELTAFLAQSGRVTWSDSLTRTGRFTSLGTLNDIAGKPVIDRGRVYAVSHSGRMVAIDLRSGQRVWSREIPSVETPWVAGEFLFVVTTEAEVLAVSRRDGRIKWLTRLDAYKNAKSRKDPIVWSGPVLFGDKLMLVSSDSRAFILSPEDGRTLRDFRLPDPTYVAPVVAGGIVYVLTNEGRLIAYGDPAKKDQARPSQPRTKVQAEPEADEKVKGKSQPFWKPRMPEWVPVI